MKRKLLIQGGIAMAVLLVLAFGIGVGRALATTGCFTDTIGHPWETYICWMKDNGITSGTTPTTYSPNGNVTRGQMAVFMQRQAEIPPSTGSININAGLNDWVANSATNGYVSYFTGNSRLRASGAGTNFYQITPDLPSSLYGRQMYTHSVKLCYDATYGASIIGVQFQHWADGTIYREAADYTVRTDAGCRIYTFSFDGLLWGGDTVVLLITANFAGSGNEIIISATTFTLNPSVYPGVLSPSDTNETRPVMEVPQPADGPAGP